MTSKLTSDERLVKILSETQATIMEHNSRCVRGSVEVDARLFESMIMELQERRKADSEPDCKERKLFCSTDTARMRKVISVSAGTEDAPLYRHVQSAPVVPDAIPVSRDIDAGYLSGWNACRAAMLAAAQHDTPALNSVQSVVTVPGKWIPVSERMPEVGVKVLCFPVKDEPIHATFNGQLWLQDVSWSGSEEPIDNVIPVSVTHWMQLPAAPQEVKGE